MLRFTRLRLETCKQYQNGTVDTHWYSEIYKLYDLSERAMSAFNMGQLNVNYALSLCRLPHKMQDSLLQIAIDETLGSMYSVSKA